jgi:PilZ domain
VRGEPGIDFPEVNAVIDVVATSRGDVLVSWVEDVRDDELIVSVAQDRSQRPVRMDKGEQLELIWRGPEELRALPVELVDTRGEAGPSWRLRPIGPAGRGQRRAAVRAPLVLPVRISGAAQTLAGTTLDLSEGGLRCVLEQAVAERARGRGGAVVGQPDPDHVPDDSPGDAHDFLTAGRVVDLAIGEADEEIRVRGEVVRRHPRTDDLEEVSIRFIGLPEFVADDIRRRVFANLRELRQRGVM